MKNFKLSSAFLLIFSVLILSSCKKEKDAHPSIQTLELIAISPGKALFKGNIVSTGSFEVIDYGFIYGSTPDVNENQGTKVSMGAEVAEGNYSKEVVLSNTSIYNRLVYARAYLTNSKGTVYGQALSVQLPTPQTSGVNPTSGKAGDKITIHGQFYTSDKNDIEVLFGNARGNITGLTPTQIVVEVPVGILVGYNSSNQISLSVKVSGQQLNSNYGFRVQPTFKDFAPKTNYPGSTISISTENLGASYNYSSSIRVFFGQTEASISSFNTNSINVTVPTTISTEKSTVSVMVDGVTTTMEGEFSLAPHTVSSISPTTGLPGSYFSIFGNNFPYNANNGANGFRVYIGDIPVNYSFNSAGQITATIPNDFPAGEYTVYVQSGPFKIPAPQKLKVTALALTGFTPTSGAAGKEITLTGNFNPNNSYQVYFGAVYANSYSGSSTSIRVNVPSNIDPGTVKISIRQGNQTVIAPDNFIVLGPSITSFTPSSGVAGSVVTITGTGFSPFVYNNVVKFGTVATTVLNATETTLRVSVPSNVATGAMKISVTNGFGQTIISSDNFTVTN